jgi:tetrapyrrole methylase family protein / MazG family protein
VDRPNPRSDDAFLTSPPEEARSSFAQAFERLVGLMARLRGEGGCPWDAAQTLETLRPYLIEEAYEVLEAVDSKSVEHHREELGDLLLQVVFHAEIRRREGHFDAADVAHGIADKLVRRHPHVFAAAEAKDASQALERWEEIKSKEKAGRSVIAGVPNQLPALLRAQRIAEKAANVGFDWEDLDGPLAKLDEELGELRAAITENDRDAIEHELGDALFSLVNLARHLHLNAEDALRGSIDRFSRRFHHVESRVKAQGKSMSETPLDEMESYWQEAKKED